VTLTAYINGKGAKYNFICVGGQYGRAQCLRNPFMGGLSLTSILPREHLKLFSGYESRITSNHHPAEFLHRTLDLCNFHFITCSSNLTPLCWGLRLTLFRQFLRFQRHHQRWVLLTLEIPGMITICLPKTEEKNDTTKYKYD
jgi:hypothetical protein